MGKTSSSNGTNKLVKVIISLDIVLFMSKFNTFRSPANSRTLKSLESLYNVGVEGRASRKGYMSIKIKWDNRIIKVRRGSRLISTVIVYMCLLTRLGRSKGSNSWYEEKSNFHLGDSVDLI